MYKLSIESKESDMKKAIIYVRRSTTKQEDSFALQRTALESFAEANGYDVVAEFKDTKSGTTNDREAFQACLEHLKSNPDTTLIVYRLDRVGRNWKALGLVEDYVSRIRSIEHGDNQIDITLFGMLNVVAKAESRAISARVKASYALRRKENPNAVFGVPKEQLIEMGKKSGEATTAKAIAFEQKVLFWNTTLNGMGYKTLKSKVQRLNELGFKTRRGCEWSIAGYNRTLKRALSRVPPLNMDLDMVEANKLAND
jgi:DNA invertase Pin-like site-specific DNA recombinase